MTPDAPPLRDSPGRRPSGPVGTLPRAGAAKGASGPVRILSNFEGMAELVRARSDIVVEHVGSDESLGACLRLAWRALRRADCLILNIDHRRLLFCCAFYALIAPCGLRRCKLVSVDVLLRPPFSFRDRCAMALKSALLRQVDLFVLYFRNREDYRRVYRLPGDRLRHVPFKVNSWEFLSKRAARIGEGSHVLCAGATLRDHATFVEAVRRSGVPAVLLLPGAMRERLGALAWYTRGVPPSLRIEFHSDGKEATYLRHFEEARIVCLPRFRWDIASTGISACLCAMALRRCVLISRGPGAEDLFEEPRAAAFFNAEDAEDLARVLSHFWNSDEERRRIALGGFRYATRLRGQARLLRDILDQALLATARDMIPALHADH